MINISLYRNTEAIYIYLEAIYPILLLRKDTFPETVQNFEVHKND